MKKSKAFLVGLVLAGAIGCNSGDTPIEVYEGKSNAAPSAAPASSQGSIKESIQSNPNMPDAAKKAVLGGK